MVPLPSFPVATTPTAAGQLPGATPYDHTAAPPSIDPLPGHGLEVKLASLHDGSRDGQLVVVSRDLSTAHHATGIATRMRQLLDDWNFVSPQLEDLYATLNGGKVRHAFAFDPRRAMAPLPRTGLYCVAAGAAPPLLQPGDELLGPHDDVAIADDGWGLAAAPALAVVSGDMAAGVAAAPALDGVRLLMLVNAWTLRERPDAWPVAACGPVAVTPDELGAAWAGGRCHGTLACHVDGQPVEAPPAAEGAHFGRLLAQLAVARRLRAGAVVAAARAPTAALRIGQRLRIEFIDADGQSPFGAIEQRVVAAH